MQMQFTHITRSFGLVAILAAFGCSEAVDDNGTSRIEQDSDIWARPTDSAVVDIPDAGQGGQGGGEAGQGGQGGGEAGQGGGEAGQGGGEAGQGGGEAGQGGGEAGQGGGEAGQGGGETRECDSSSDCNQGGICKRGSCSSDGVCSYSDIAGCCEDVNDCNGQASTCKTWACEQNLCVERGVAGCCTSDNDCQQRCNTATNECVQCLTVADCPEHTGEIASCVSNSCRYEEDTSFNCRGNDENCFIDACHTSYCLTTGACSHLSRENCCIYDSDCEQRTGYTATCSNNSCNYAMNQGYCENNSHCGNTEVCDIQNHTCVGCLQDSDCRGSNICEIGRGVCNQVRQDCIYDYEGCCMEDSDCGESGSECVHNSCVFEENLIDWCRFQHPSNSTYAINQGETFSSYVHIYEKDLTGNQVPDNAIKVELCASSSTLRTPEDCQITAPMKMNLNFNRDQAPNHDEYWAEEPEELMRLTAGTYNVAARVSADGGRTWTLCDRNVSGQNCGAPGGCDDGVSNGTGANEPRYQPENTLKLTVNSPCGICEGERDLCLHGNLFHAPAKICNPQTLQCVSGGEASMIEQCDTCVEATSNQPAHCETAAPSCYCATLYTACANNNVGYITHTEKRCEAGAIDDGLDCGSSEDFYESCHSGVSCQMGEVGQLMQVRASCGVNMQPTGYLNCMNSTQIYANCEGGTTCGEVFGQTGCVGSTCTSDSQCDTSTGRYCRDGHCARTISWCALQTPGDGNINTTAGSEVTIYLRLNPENVPTLANGELDMAMRFGIAPKGTGVDNLTKWQMTDIPVLSAIKNTECTTCGPNNEYKFTFNAPTTAGQYDVVGFVSTDSRVSNTGVEYWLWTVCDREYGMGTGSLDGYDPNLAIHLNVQ